MLWHNDPQSDIDLEDITAILCTRLWLSMMLHDTRFSYKTSSTWFIQMTSSEQTFTEIMDPQFDLETEANSPFFFYKTLQIVTIYHQISKPENIVKSWFRYLSLCNLDVDFVVVVVVVAIVVVVVVAAGFVVVCLFLFFAYHSGSWWSTIMSKIWL